MEEVYNAILQGLESLGFYEGSRKGYLQSLQPHVHGLRLAYRNNHVSIDYSEAAKQAAYLIAYYPGHIEMTFSILMKIWQRLSFGPEVKACFFGGGPGPEVAALARLLAEQEGYLRVGALTADIFDIRAEGWLRGMNITAQHVLPRLWPGQVILRKGQLDLCGRDSFQRLRTHLQNYDLVVLQNCLNELERRSNFIENVSFLLGSVPQGSIVIFADLARYGVNAYSLDRIKEIVKERRDFEEVLCIDESTIYVSPASIPLMITENLLLSASELHLRPRTNIRYAALVVSKVPANHMNYDEIPF